MVEIDAVIHGADEHRLRTESGMVKCEFPLRAAFGVSDFLHSTLKLDQDRLNSRRCFAGRAVSHRAANRPCLGYRSRSQNERAEQSQTVRVSALHCALPAVARVPRGRRTCAFVTWSISASTSAASFSSPVFIASKSPSEYFPERYSNRKSRRLS